MHWITFNKATLGSIHLLAQFQQNATIHLHSQVLPPFPLSTRHFPRPWKSLSVLYCDPQEANSAAPACLPDPQWKDFPSRHRFSYTDFLWFPKRTLSPLRTFALACCPLSQNTLRPYFPVTGSFTWLTVGRCLLTGPLSLYTLPPEICCAPSRKCELHKAGTLVHGCIFLT